MVKLLVIMDPIQHIHIEKDTTFALLVAAQKRQWEIYYVEPKDLFLRDGQVYGFIKSLQLYERAVPWYSFINLSEKLALTEFDIILMRQDPPFDINYLNTTYLLDIAVNLGCKVVNLPQSVRDANEKIFATWFPHCCPPTLVTTNHDLFMDFLAEHQKIILKPLNYMGGKGIFVLEKDQPNVHSAFELLTQNNQMIMIQRYLPEIKQGDKRILLINGTMYPYAIARMPKADDFRGNLAAGAKAIKHIPTDHDRWLCEQIAPTLKSKRLFFVGVDIIGDYITEINVTSPTCVREIEHLFEVNVSETIIEALWAGFVS